VTVAHELTAGASDAIIVTMSHRQASKMQTGYVAGWAVRVTVGTDFGAVPCSTAEHSGLCSSNH
jgi:hypothetical protein